MQTFTVNDIIQDYVHIRELDETNHTIYTQQDVSDAETVLFVHQTVIQPMLEKIEKLKTNKAYILRAKQERFNTQLNDIKERLVQLRHAYTIDDEQTQYESLLEHIDGLIE